ncbi:MAG: hypothetical protein PHE61_04740, partial [Candidatus Omnitrophica bacterium]|nr:hypothetical protein [Candidatus Omnitrophota bacterium]
MDRRDIPVPLVSTCSVSIPQDLGSIDEYFVPEVNGRLTTDDERLVIYLQDCHSSLEAQLNIASIIKHLVKEYGVKTVYEEGYEGEVPSDELFNIKDKAIKEKVSYFFLDHLRLSGAEYAHINREEDFDLIGAEDFKLYVKDLEQYKLSSKDQVLIDKQLSTLSKTLSQIGEAQYPKGIKEYKKLKGKFNRRELSLLDYLLRLAKLYAEGSRVRGQGARKEGIDNFPLPNGERIKVRGSNTQIDSPANPLTGSPDSLVTQYLSTKYKFISLIHEYTNKRRITKEDQEKFQKVFSNLNPKDFFKELSQFENEIKDIYLNVGADPCVCPLDNGPAQGPAPTTGQSLRQLLQYEEDLAILYKLNHLQLTEEEYGLYQERIKSALQTEEIARFISPYLKRPVLLYKEWEKLLLKNVDFYEIAQDRETTVVQKVVRNEIASASFGLLPRNDGDARRTMQDARRSPVVLVMGGFHSNGIKQKLRSQNISFIAISPRITKEDTKHEERYEFLMNGKYYDFEKPYLLSPAISATRPEGIYAGHRSNVFDGHALVSNQLGKSLGRVGDEKKATIEKPVVGIGVENKVSETNSTERLLPAAVLSALTFLASTLVMIWAMFQLTNLPHFIGVVSAIFATLGIGGFIYSISGKEFRTQLKSPKYVMPLVLFGVALMRIVPIGRYPWMDEFCHTVNALRWIETGNCEFFGAEIPYTWGFLSAAVTLLSRPFFSPLLGVRFLSLSFSVGSAFFVYKFASQFFKTVFRGGETSASDKSLLRWGPVVAAILFGVSNSAVYTGIMAVHDSMGTFFLVLSMWLMHKGISDSPEKGYTGALFFSHITLLLAMMSKLPLMAYGPFAIVYSLVLMGVLSGKLSVPVVKEWFVKCVLPLSLMSLFAFKFFS